MKKKIVIGSLLVVFIMVLLPTNSVAESSSATKRIEKQQAFFKELEEKLYPKNWEPTCILRLLLWLRNAIIIGVILIIIKIIKDLFNQSSISASN